MYVCVKTNSMYLHQQVRTQGTNTLRVSEYLIRTYGRDPKLLWDRLNPLHTYDHNKCINSLFLIFSPLFSFFLLPSACLSCIVSAPRVIMDEIRKSGCIIQICNTQTKGEWQLFSLPVTYSTKALTVVSICVRTRFCLHCGTKSITIWRPASSPQNECALNRIT